MATKYRIYFPELGDNDIVYAGQHTIYNEALEKLQCGLKFRIFKDKEITLAQFMAEMEESFAPGGDF